MIPRPSTCGAFVWQLPRSAVAITFSRGVLSCSAVLALGVLVCGRLSCATLYFIVEHGRGLAIGFLLLNAASATLVRIGPGGVRARRLFAPWARSQLAPLGGRFNIGTPEPGGLDAIVHDRWSEYVVHDDDGARVSVSFPGLRPEASGRWLTEQLHRIQSQQLPGARIVERRRGEP